ncbi:MAG: hypothetical protein VKM17_10300 [Cyanobacteriota bacterium]|nr:hypothetical protein [Cyanobacteriota bacterium]
MRLVLVHGINQQHKDPDALRKEWIADLERGLGRPGVLADVHVEMPFYGDALLHAANSASNGAIAQGENPDDDRSLAQFLAEGLDEQAAAMGISRAEITTEQERVTTEDGGGIAVDQGFPMSRRINALVSLIERISPFRGDLVVRLLDQAHAYLKKPQATLAVDALVRPALEAGPMVLVSHSLGTVVSFKLLRLLAASGNPAQVPLYVTLGSPLPLSTVQRALGPSFATPAGVNRWINARDPDDVISLNRGLGAPLFSSSIENISDLENPGADAHAIPGYLSYPPVAQAIAHALGD